MIACTRMAQVDRLLEYIEENVDRGKEIVRRHEARMMQGPRESRRRWEWATGAHR